MQIPCPTLYHRCGILCAPDPGEMKSSKPLLVAFIDLTKAFDRVSRDGLFKLLHKIGCPLRVLHLTKSFHSNMMVTLQFDGSTSILFNIVSGVKQGCVLAPTLFGIFFSLMLKYAFGNTSEGIFLHTHSNG